MKKYKALITDVDGTLILNQRDGSPTPKIIQAIKKAQQKIHVGVATSRPLFMIQSINKKIQLKGPSIINGGAQIVDMQTNKIYWQKLVDPENIPKVYKIFNELGVNLWIQDNDSDQRVTANYQANQPTQFFCDNIEHTLADEIVDKISKNTTNLVAHKVPSWTKGKLDMVITHTEATKQHGIFELAKILNIETQDIIGIGDGYNDFPLLMACGLKVAMGNAVDDLKAIADYIAPTVEEDGLADVIQKFVLDE